jgi:hypothetical protein
MSGIEQDDVLGTVLLVGANGLVSHTNEATRLAYQRPLLS